jgi:hypothetical protein
MPRHRECSHTERYNDGHCKLCTRERQRVTQARYRAEKRALSAPKVGGPLTMDELLGVSQRKPRHDLL